MNILFYYPSNKRTIPIDVPLLELKKNGHSIFLLTTVEWGPLHRFYHSHGVSVEGHPAKIAFKPLRFVLQLIYLIIYCRRNRIDVVHSHLQQANVIAVFARFFTKCRIIIFRHHCKFHFLLSKTTLRPPARERIADFIINLLAKKIVVPSSAVKDVMKGFEKVDGAKIQIIPYIYDFAEMIKINPAAVAEITAQFPARLRIIMVSRLTPFKRHREALHAVAPLILAHPDIQFLIMDDGPERETIEGLIKEFKLQGNIHLLGFRDNILDYLAACDILVHPSLTDASNSALKEAGLLRKIVIACDQVGDVNDYIINGANGFLVSPGKFAEEAREILQMIYDSKIQFEALGEELHRAVVTKFRKSSQVVDLYEHL